MRRLNASEDEMKMADNYYAILANKIPEVWFDQGIELGGGQPFTVGTAGDERNKQHILKATKYLDSLVDCKGSDCESRAYADLHPVRKDSHAAGQRVFSVAPDRPLMRAACGGRACVLVTNIQLIPADTTHLGDKAGDMLVLEKYNAALMGETGVSHYVTFPPSHAVDGSTKTLFRSLGGAFNSYLICATY
jgi:hypothetical protein